MIPIRPWTIVLVGLLALPAAVLGQAKKPTAGEWLESQGLKRLSSSFTVDAEGEFNKLVRELGDRQKQLVDAQRKLTQLEEQAKQRDQLITQYLQQRREIRARRAATTSVITHNQLVNAENELADRIMLLQQQSQDDTPLKEARGEVNKASEQYVELLLKGRELHDAAVARYDQLKANPHVARAVAAVSKADNKKYALGPTSSFQANARRLAKLEQTVLSEEIALRRGASGLWFVSVMFNGKHAQEMAIDTGASIVVLPADVARQAGLEPETSEDSVLTLTVADGSQIQAQRAVADSVRVGKFTVEGVECAILPPGLPGVMPLLGQTYLQHFAYKIDSAAGKLVMTQVQGEEKK